MLRSLALLAASTLCFAQAPAPSATKAPVEVEQALRARVSEFYQFHMEGKFRQAEALVAEDSKDFFYGGQKTKYLSFEIIKIDWDDNFTHARVVTNCEQYLPIAQFADRPLKVPMVSFWKLVDGQWFWYIETRKLVDTPWGKIKPQTADGPPSGNPFEIPKANDVFHAMLQQVKADKDMVNLKGGSSEQVTITNNAPGAIAISLMGTIPGVDIKLDRMNIKAGEKAVITFRASAAAKPGIVSVVVEQTYQVIPIQVSID